VVVLDQIESTRLPALTHRTLRTAEQNRHCASLGTRITKERLTNTGGVSTILERSLSSALRYPRIAIAGPKRLE
jgi:hypothetical protein